MPLHFIILQLGNKTYKDKVSTQGCDDVADFKGAIKSKWTNLLKDYDAGQLTLFESDGITEIDPETEMNEVFVTKGKPLVVKVDEQAPIAQQLTEKHLISSTRHQDYKQRKAFVSSRNYLTSLALELDKIYPIVKEKSAKGRDKPVTFGTIINNAYSSNPDPMPQFKNLYKKLNAHFTDVEWNYLEALNDTVNGHLHLPLNPGEDIKYLILPSDFSGYDKISQTIAKKSNVVSDASNLIVKNEGSVSGGSPDSDKRL